MNPQTPTRYGTEAIEDLRAQAQGSQLAGFGQVQIVPLNKLEPTTDTVGSTVTAPSTAVLRYWLMGDVAHFSLDTYARLTLAGGTCTQIRFRLPDGMKGASRAPLSGGPEARQGIARCYIIDPTAGSVDGFLAIENGWLTVQRDNFTAINTGTTLGVYGQVWAEVVRPDEA